MFVDRHDVRGPDRRILGGPRAAGCQQGVQCRVGFRVYEEVREHGMGRVGRRRREHDLGVRGELDLADPPAEVRDGHPTHLGVVLGRHYHLERRRDRAVAPSDLGAVLGEDGLVGVRLDAARLVGR